MDYIEVTKTEIRSMANKISGGVGPFGISSAIFKKILLLFGNNSNFFRTSIIKLFMLFFNTFIHLLRIVSVIVSRLISIHKSSGVRLIRIGEVI